MKNIKCSMCDKTVSVPDKIKPVERSIVFDGGVVRTRVLCADCAAKK